MRNHEHYSRSSLHLCTMVELSWGGIKFLLGFCLVLLKELNCVFPHEHCSRVILQHWFLQLLLMFALVNLPPLFSGEPHTEIHIFKIGIIIISGFFCYKYICRQTCPMIDKVKKNFAFV